MEKICIDSTNYVRLNGNHMFTKEKLKAFLTIILVRGYTGLPRQQIYWERREDCYNLVLSVTMTKIGFLECKQYLHLPDNNDLKSSTQIRTYAGKDSILEQYENIGLGLGASVVANLVSKFPVM